MSLIKNYLSNRFNIVKYQNCTSDRRPVTAVVPQGSVLGPLLFIIFMNDICFFGIKSTISLFADDTEISFASKSITELVSVVSADLIIIEKWLSHNRLILNVKKTNAMFFSFSNRMIQCNDLIKLKLNNIEIPFVETVKYLGVIIDKKLKFDHHTISVCHKVNYKTIVLKKCAYLFDFGLKQLFSNYLFFLLLIIVPAILLFV